MPDFIYTVTGTFADSGLLERWIAWLESGHVQEVVRVGGALQADIVRMEGVANKVQVCYRFSSAEAFASYERDRAPRLREEGLKLFPASDSIRYERSTGTVIATVRSRDRQA